VIFEKIFFPVVFTGILAVCMTASLVAQQQEFPDPAFFAGSYRLVGKALESDSTFEGTLVLLIAEDSLIVVRRVNGERLQGRWGIEPVLEGELRVVRMRFSQGDGTLEATYLWQADLDNYPRMSGYLYRKGLATDDPGLEVLFYQLQDIDENPPAEREDATR